LPASVDAHFLSIDPIVRLSISLAGVGHLSLQTYSALIAYAEYGKDEELFHVDLLLHATVEPLQSI
jgi:hypothetical protein